MKKEKRKVHKPRVDGYFKRKIDLEELRDLYNQGHTQREMAKTLGVTQGAVCHALRQIKGGTAKEVALIKGHEIVTEGLNTVRDLNKINSVINTLLDEITAQPAHIERLTNAIHALLEDRGTKEDKQRVRDTLTAVIHNYELQIKASQEIRGQHSLQAELYKTMVDIREVAAFQQTVLGIIGKQSERVRNEIVTALKKERALRESVRLF